MKYHIITLFPESFESYISSSIIGRARERKKITLSFYNPRDFVTGKLKKVWPDGNISSQIDGRPFGGGPGMVMRPEPLIGAVTAILKKIKKRKKPSSVEIIFFSPHGSMFDTSYAKEIAQTTTDIIMICGRYEGIDARVPQIFDATHLSIGTYVLTGGELPALVVMDCISRQIPGVLGKQESLEEERISGIEVYTRPEVLHHDGKDYHVPEVLLSGDHKKIELWKKSLTPKKK
jgi:tRNA (guanine37-N1)-methyltransferase